jgi:hypothetical protein
LDKTRKSKLRNWATKDDEDDVGDEVTTPARSVTMSSKLKKKQKIMLVSKDEETLLGIIPGGSFPLRNHEV